jgi:O-antigen/teichoic acid export membrane protein
MPSAPGVDGDPPVEGAAEPGREPVEELLSSGDVRKRAASGVLLVGVRSVAIRGVGLASNLVLARLLVPEDFGVLAFGQTLIVFGTFFADAGLAAGLIRRDEAPRREELQSILGFQVLVATVLLLCVATVAVPTGRTGQVATVMAISVVVGAYRSPAALLLERRLEYRSLAFAEVAEGIVFAVFSVTTVALGAGVWGVAVAQVVRAATGSALMITRSPMRVLRPRLRFSVIRSLLRFGILVQAGGAVNLVRAQGMNLATAALAGLPVLGLISLADRIMQLPWLVFESILRVTFPAMARLVAAGVDPRSDLERGLKLLTFTAGSLLALVAGTAPVLVPSFFGDAWTGAAVAIPLTALGMLVAGPLIAVGDGYLYAVGDARANLLATSAHAVVWFLVAVPLLSRFGVTAVGAATLVGFTAEALVLSRAIKRHTDLRCLRIMMPTMLPVIVAGGVGHLLARTVDPSLLTTGAVGTATLALLIGGFLLSDRSTMTEVRRLAGGLAAARGHEGTPPAAAKTPQRLP